MMKLDPLFLFVLAWWTILVIVAIKMIDQWKRMSREAKERRAGQIAAEAYQVIGSIADAGGLYGHPQVSRAMDYFDAVAAGRQPAATILPFRMEGISK